LAVGALVATIAMVGIAVPLLYYGGVQGYAVGRGIAAMILVMVRFFYLQKLFPLRPIFGNVVRGLLPVVVALAGTLCLRFALSGGERTEVEAAAELALFLGLAGVATFASARALLGEFREYLRRPTPATA
jgi:hypothetical protein